MSQFKDSKGVAATSVLPQAASQVDQAAETTVQKAVIERSKFIQGRIKPYNEDLEHAIIKINADSDTLIKLTRDFPKHIAKQGEDISLKDGNGSSTSLFAGTALRDPNFLKRIQSSIVETVGYIRPAEPGTGVEKHLPPEKLSLLKSLGKTNETIEEMKKDLIIGYLDSPVQQALGTRRGYGEMLLDFNKTLNSALGNKEAHETKDPDAALESVLNESIVYARPANSKIGRSLSCTTTELLFSTEDPSHLRDFNRTGMSYEELISKIPANNPNASYTLIHVGKNTERDKVLAIGLNMQELSNQLDYYNKNIDKYVDQKNKENLIPILGSKCKEHSPEQLQEEKVSENYTRPRATAIDSLTQISSSFSSAKRNLPEDTQGQGENIGSKATKDSLNKDSTPQSQLATPQPTR